MSEEEMIKGVIVRALRRDAPGKNTWTGYINQVADWIEMGEIVITKKGEVGCYNWPIEKVG
jgi:hypothetical protein